MTNRSSETIRPVIDGLYRFKEISGAKVIPVMRRSVCQTLRLQTVRFRIGRPRRVFAKHEHSRAWMSAEWRERYGTVRRVSAATQSSFIPPRSLWPVQR